MILTIQKTCYPKIMNPTRMIAMAMVLSSVSLVSGEEILEIATDRPDFVESALTVPRHHFQFETSAAVVDDDSGGVESTLWITPTLLRYGLFDRWELRLETAGYASVEEKTGSNTTLDESGWSDVALGVKWHTADGHDALPAQAWLLHTDLDTGQGVFKGRGVRASLRWVGEWDFQGIQAFGLMAGYASNKDDLDERYGAGVFGAVLGQQWTAKFRSFFELAAPQIASDEHGGDVATLDIGVAYLLRPNWQLDGAVYIGITDETPDVLYTIGLSALF